MSGQVRFDSNGDRDFSTVSYALTNWNNQSEAQVVATFDFQAQSWVWADSGLVFFKHGYGLANGPSDFANPTENFNYLPSWVWDLAYFFIGALSLLCLLAAALLIAYRDTRYVVTSQPMFMGLAITGCLLASWGILGLAVDDYANAGSIPLNCMLAPILFSLGMTLSLSSILAKSVRVFSMFHKSRLLRVGIPFWQTMLIVVGITGVNLLLLLLWLGIAPMQWIRAVTDVNIHGDPVSSLGSCAISYEGQIFAGVLIMYQIALLIAVGIVAVKIRNFPPEYHEAQPLLLAVIAQLQLYFIGIPLYLTIASNPVSRFVILSLLILFMVVVVFLSLLGPRLLLARDDAVRRAILSAPKPKVTIMDGLRNEIVRERFKPFAEKHMQVESFSFFCDMIKWEDEYKSASDEWKINTAKRFIETYLKERSLLEINVSDESRKKVIACIQANIQANTVPPMESFEPALRDLNVMVSQGLFVCCLLFQNAY